MGLATGLMPFLMQEGARRPWSGDVLTLGRQNIAVTGKDLTRLNADPSLRCLVRQPISSDDRLSDHQLFRALGFDRVFALDINAYENADYIVDMNAACVPSHLQGRFDLVFDGGTLEHVFDIATALRNTCQMVKPGGRIMHMGPMSNCADHGFYSFSPVLFADFYSANKWDIHRITVARFEPDTDFWELTDYHPNDYGTLGQLGGGAYLVLVCVQATSESTFDLIPQQSFFKKLWAETHP